MRNVGSGSILFRGKRTNVVDSREREQIKFELKYCPSQSYLSQLCQLATVYVLVWTDIDLDRHWFQWTSAWSNIGSDRHRFGWTLVRTEIGWDRRTLVLHGDAKIVIFWLISTQKSAQNNFNTSTIIKRMFVWTDICFEGCLFKGIKKFLTFCLQYFSKYFYSGLTQGLHRYR